MIQKENLLKLLLNKPVDNPNENVPSYSNSVYYQNNLATKSLEYFENPFFATPYRMITDGNISFGFNTQSRIWFRTNADKSMSTYIAKMQYSSIIDVFHDESGWYSITIANNRVFLNYMEDINKENIWEFRMYYDITQMLIDVTGDPAPQNSVYNGALKIHKSPIDGRFLIATSLLNQQYFAVIEYTVNVGSENTYRYQRFSSSDITTSFPTIDDMFVSWTDSNVSYAIGVIGTNSVIQSKQNVDIFEFKGDMSSISHQMISHLIDVICGALYMKVAHTPQIRYKTMTDRYYSYSVVKSNTQVIDDVTWTDGEVVFTRLNGTTRTELSRTHTDYMISTQSSSYKNEFDIIIKNDCVFGIETILTAPDKIQATFKQIVNGELHGKIVYTDKDYVRTGLGFSMISNVFNLYTYSYQLDDRLYSIDSVFKPTGYNGEAYFNRNSLNSESGELYDITSKVVFARDLYNKSIVGDTINSILHVPSIYLNINPIIKENLISETNSVIDEGLEEISKNEYEELYINFIDSYKIWDKNDKSTYQQNASHQLAKQISNEMEMYVANFRVTNQDDSVVESTLGNIPIIDGEGVIDIDFMVPTGGSKTFEIYNQDFTIQFATIDITNLTPGAYRLVEKIKIE